MKAEDLMVGDWVFLFDDKFAKVDCIGNTEVYLSDENGLDWQVTYEHIKPIPLTSEFLEKNGFVKSERYEVWKIISDEYELRITPWRVAVIFLDEDGSDKEEFSVPRSKYVDELQRALRCVGLYEFANNIKI